LPTAAQNSKLLFYIRSYLEVDLASIPVSWSQLRRNGRNRLWSSVVSFYLFKRKTTSLGMETFEGLSLAAAEKVLFKNTTSE